MRSIVRSRHTTRSSCVSLFLALLATLHKVGYPCRDAKIIRIISFLSVSSSPFFFFTQETQELRTRRVMLMRVRMTRIETWLGVVQLQNCLAWEDQHRDQKPHHRRYEFPSFNHQILSKRDFIFLGQSTLYFSTKEFVFCCNETQHVTLLLVVNLNCNNLKKRQQQKNVKPHII